MIIEILTQVCISSLGIIIYTLFKFRNYLIKREDVSTKIFWRSFREQNQILWLWTFVVVLILSITINILPESGSAIKTMTGLDVEASKVAFLSLGFFASASIDNNPDGK